MTPNYWAGTVEETGPAIDRVLDHRPKPDIGNEYQHWVHMDANSVTELEPYSVQKKDFEYLVRTPRNNTRPCSNHATDQMAGQSSLSFHMGGIQHGRRK